MRKLKGVRVAAIVTITVDDDNVLVDRETLPTNSELTEFVRQCIIDGDHDIREIIYPEQIRAVWRDTAIRSHSGDLPC